MLHQLFVCAVLLAPPLLLSFLEHVPHVKWSLPGKQKSRRRQRWREVAVQLIRRRPLSSRSRVLWTHITRRLSLRFRGHLDTELVSISLPPRRLPALLLWNGKGNVALLLSSYSAIHLWVKHGHAAKKVGSGPLQHKLGHGLSRELDRPPRLAPGGECDVGNGSSPAIAASSVSAFDPFVTGGGTPPCLSARS